MDRRPHEPLEAAYRTSALAPGRRAGAGGRAAARASLPLLLLRRRPAPLRPRVLAARAPGASPLLLLRARGVLLRPPRGRLRAAARAASAAPRLLLTLLAAGAGRARWTRRRVGLG